jgi:16S rRNA (cytosine967-C5)-methyltransferase
MIAPARVAAYDALHRVQSGREDLPQALAHVRAGLGDERDRALALEIATGTLRWQAAFDHILTGATGRPVSRLDPEVLIILRLTLFQLFHLDRVPASAAVNDAVSLARRAGKRSAAPLVNAVLRRVSRQRSQPLLPERPVDDADTAGAQAYLSTTLSHPRWLIARWLARHGFQATEAWARFNNASAPLTLRVNPLRATMDSVVAALAMQGVRVEPGRFAADALIVVEGNPLLTTLAGDGSFFVQDEASQVVADFVGAERGECILDACASPGGKTTAMAAAMGDTGLVVAADFRERRVDLLARTVAVSGARSIRVLRANAEGPLPFTARFDAVLVDAPCSGLGIVRRDPDVKWRRSESDLPPLAAAQRRLLQQAAEVVRPGGRLIYATCSSEPDENEDVVGAFLDDRADFRAGSPYLANPAAAALVDRAGRLRTLPHRDGLDAFFAATLVKTRNSQ